jgi:hypothetical protein
VFEWIGTIPLRLRPPLVDTLDCATMDPYREANRRLWEEWAAIHPRAEFYRVEDFKRGWDPLKPFASATRPRRPRSTSSADRC